MNFFSTWIHSTGKAKVLPSPLTAHLKVREQDRSKYPKGRKFTGETGWTAQGRKWARARAARTQARLRHRLESLDRWLPKRDHFV